MASNSPKKTDLRAVPMQARSRERFEAIVAAAAKLFADEGFDTTTMEAIAASAGTSIGSVYRFFPNKLEVFREIAKRCLAGSDAAFFELLGPNPLGRAWHELLDAVIDGFAQRMVTDDLFRAAWRNLQLYDEYAVEDEALMEELNQRTAALMMAWAPKLAAARRKALAKVVVHTIVSMLYGISRNDVKDPAELIAETKLMLRRYLEPEVAP